MKYALIYSPGYDFSLLGLERLHPFDARKSSRAFAIVRKQLGGSLDSHWRQPRSPVSDEELLSVHSKRYLESLRSPAVVAKALEVWPLQFTPRRLVERGVVLPMRLAVAGTLLAFRAALTDNASFAMNLGGGFHHAFPEHGEGFCLFADVAVAIALERARGTLRENDRIAIIDLDAHRGNGVWQILGTDPAVHILDLYNFQAYPGLLDADVEEFPFQIPFKARTPDAMYLDTLRTELPKFLDSVGRPRIAIYNAGTDIVEGDPIGRLSVSPQGVNARDRIVVEALASRGIPTVIVTSGGYTKISHELIAQLAISIATRAETGAQEHHGSRS